MKASTGYAARCLTARCRITKGRSSLPSTQWESRWGAATGTACSFFEAFWLGAGLWMLFAALAQVFGRRAAFAGCAVFAVSLPTFLNDVGNMTESWNFLFQALALLCLMRLLRQNTNSAVWAALLGVCGAGALLLRPNLGVAFGCATVLWLWLGHPRRNQIISLLLGLTLPVAVTGLYLWQHGAWDAMKDQYFGYNSAYSNYPGVWHARAHLLVWSLKMLVSWRGGFLGLVGLVPAVLLLLRARSASKAKFQKQGQVDLAKRALCWMLVVGLPLETLADSVSGYVQPHYLVPRMMFLALGVALAFDWWEQSEARRSSSSRRRRFSWATGALALWLGLSLTRIAWEWRELSRMPRTVSPQVALARFLTNHTTPDQPVLLWGSETRIYLLAHRRSASRYIYVLPLLNLKYGTAERGREFVAEVERARPPILVDLHNYGLDLARGPAKGEEVAPAVRVVAASLLRSYEWRGETMPGPDGVTWKIYRRRRNAPAMASGPARSLF